MTYEFEKMRAEIIMLNLSMRQLIGTVKSMEDVRGLIEIYENELVKIMPDRKIDEKYDLLYRVVRARTMQILSNIKREVELAGNVCYAVETFKKGIRNIKNLVEDVADGLMLVEGV
jgi:hypothetical protein